MDYVEAVLAKEVAIHCESNELKKNLEQLGAVASHSGRWLMAYDSRSELAERLSALQALDIFFLDEPAGWPPAAVYEFLRNEGLVRGDVRKISWHGPGQPFIH